MRPRAPLVGLALLLLVTSCQQRKPAPDPEYRAEIERFRTERAARLTAEDGWLSLVGLYWLEPGANRFGSAPANDIVLAGEAIPPFAGILDVDEDGGVTLRTAAASGLTVAGEPVEERRLATDADGEADVLALGTLRVHVIDRGGRLGLRVKDLASEARQRFSGIESFPVDPAYRVEGHLQRYPAPRTVAVASAQGPDQAMLVPGVVTFSLHGRELSLEPYVSSPDDDTLFFVFRDTTSGTTTYGAGRFLSVRAPAAGATGVELDFNRAINPPCAFTPYATCPVASAANTLPVAVEAGEMMRGGGHH